MRVLGHFNTENSIWILVIAQNLYEFQKKKKNCHFWAQNILILPGLEIPQGENVLILPICILLLRWLRLKLLSDDVSNVEQPHNFPPKKSIEKYWEKTNIDTIN